MLLAGCASVVGPAVAPPKVTVEAVGLTRSGIVSQEVTLGLGLQNRADRELDVDSVSLNLGVNGKRMGSGVLLKPFVLPADGSARIDVPVTISTGDLLDAMGRLGNNKKIAYTLEGQLHLAANEGVVAFTDEGEVALPFPLPSVPGS